MNIFKNPDTKRGALIGGSLILCIVLIWVLVDGFLHTSNQKNKTVSPYILSLTSPITSIVGKVTSVKNNTVVVAVEQPNTKPILFNVMADEKTAFAGTPVPYLFDSSKHLAFTVADIAPGSNVTIYTREDLRTLKDPTFTAVSIIVSSFPNTVTGSIIKVEKGSLQIAPYQPATVKNPYTVIITSSTEMSFMNGSVPERVTTDDLTAGMPITVFIKGTVTEQTSQATALRIEPFIKP